MNTNQITLSNIDLGVWGNEEKDSTLYIQADVCYKGRSERMLEWVRGDEEEGFEATESDSHIDIQQSDEVKRLFGENPDFLTSLDIKDVMTKYMSSKAHSDFDESIIC